MASRLQDETDAQVCARAEVARDAGAGEIVKRRRRGRATKSLRAQTAPMPAAPPVTPLAARRAILAAMAWVFDLAVDDTGCHAPYAMDAERECLKAVHKTVTRALTMLPKKKLIALAHKLHGLDEAKDFEIDALAQDYERTGGWGDR